MLLLVVEAADRMAELCPSPACTCHHCSMSNYYLMLPISPQGELGELSGSLAWLANDRSGPGNLGLSPGVNAIMDRTRE